MNFFINWVNKSTDVENIESSEGSAVYSSLSYSTAGLGITLKYYI
ncbi:MAG: hypothetical protein PVH88_03905 [Ignavibacteria bacterium]